MRRYTVVYSDTARADLRALARYIATEGAGAQTAFNVVSRIEKHCLSLEPLPERGVRQRTSGRSIQFERVFKITFRVGDHRVDILGVGYRGRVFKSWDPA